ncbi:PqiC family protein [Pedosphaera parvula]|nr:PqiC family protein [Pedosphaera parvula]
MCSPASAAKANSSPVETYQCNSAALIWLRMWRILGFPVRKGENQIDYLQYYNWAEPIHAGIERTMRENLSEELGILVGRNSVARSSDENNFEVRINISRFELTDKNQAIVSGDWMILHGNGVRKGRVELRKNFPGSKTDAGPGVAALSGALSELCQQIAKEIQGQ